MNIDKAIRFFSDFLNKSWETVIPLLSDRLYTSDESSKNDWIQANWELLVERKVLQLNEYLEIYGDGADFNGISSRITDVESIPTHSITVLVSDCMDILNNVKINAAEYLFEQLVGFKNGFYINSNPFNFVLVQDKDTNIERVFLLDGVKFQLRLYNS